MQGNRMDNVTYCACKGLAGVHKAADKVQHAFAQGARRHLATLRAYAKYLTGMPKTLYECARNKELKSHVS